MVQHFILRVGDGLNFRNSSKMFIWAVKSRNKTFLLRVKKGDKLWFIQNKSKDDTQVGKIIAVADFMSHNKRDIGPLISITLSNDELGWNDGDKYDVEIHYSNLYNLTDCELYSGYHNQNTIWDYDNVKSKFTVDLILEYDYICRYSKATQYM